MPTKSQVLGLHLRRARERYSVGLRELARQADVSAAYLSSVENGQEVGSERILKIYASRFRMDFDELSRVAGRVPTDMQTHLVKTPGAIAKLRDEMADKKLPKKVNGRKQAKQSKEREKKNAS